MSEAGEKLLLVDDDEAFLQVMGRALRRRGFEVLPAMTAEEALAAATNPNDMKLALRGIVSSAEAAEESMEVVRGADARRPQG